MPAIVDDILQKQIFQKSFAFKFKLGIGLKAYTI